MMTMRSWQTLAVLLLVLISASLTAEVYRWVDDQGRVHFSDRPPGDTAPGYGGGREGQPARDPSQATPQVGIEAGRREKQQRLLRALESERKEKEAAAEQARKKQAVRAHNCELARARLRTAQNVNRIFEYDAKGNKVYLDQAGVAREIAAHQAQVERWCR